jgi:hypothetical protein
MEILGKSAAEVLKSFSVNMLGLSADYGLIANNVNGEKSV